MPGVQLAVPVPAQDGSTRGDESAQSVPEQQRLGPEAWAVQVRPGAQPGTGCASQRHPFEPTIQGSLRPVSTRPVGAHTLATPPQPQQSLPPKVPKPINLPQPSDTGPQLAPPRVGVAQSAAVNGVQGVH